MGGNQLNHLVVKNCPELRYLIVSHNRLERLDIEGCPNLKTQYSYNSDKYEISEPTDQEKAEIEFELKRQEENNKVAKILQQDESNPLTLNELKEAMDNLDPNLVSEQYHIKLITLFQKKLAE